MLKPLAKNISVKLELTTAASLADAAIHQKIFELGMTTLVISNEEMNDIIEIVQSLEESSLLVNRVSQTINNKAKKQKGRFLSMLLGTFVASFLGNLLTGKGTIGTDEGAIRVGQDC